MSVSTDKCPLCGMPKRADEPCNNPGCYPKFGTAEELEAYAAPIVAQMAENERRRRERQR